ncbi:MAG: bifunctional methylenetetrahydrofolate dehydrogenase/methenyltetrahydrofolate cyclohydrolase FolD [Spirochaetes bacterium]|nr:bifunctional methylenetetrahydrofolate dehydrogenase/methenyltetrahydrofolate cyclohydrolase FolD [Spirochaetota bacterium]
MDSFLETTGGLWYKNIVELIDGKRIAQTVRATIQAEVHQLKRLGIVPGLAVILVGEDPASISYVTGKEKACAEMGIRSFDHRLPDTTPPETLFHLIERLNQDPSVDGILLQLPLPRGLPERQLLNCIDPEKDVDGFHPMNLGKLLLGEETFLPCTPHGILKIFELEGIDPAGKHVVILGRSITVGRPLLNLLSRKGVGGNATVTICHTGTPNVSFYTRQADILVVATGSPRLVQGSMVKEGVVVIDVGVNRIPDPTKKSGYRLVGDVDFDSVAPKASKITPVPGGVGPMTITMLLYNTVWAAKKREKSNRSVQGRSVGG